MADTQDGVVKTDKLHKEAVDRFKVCMDAWAENRKLWLEDTQFQEQLDQWPEAVKKLRQIPGQERPCLVVDKIGQYVKQVVNDGRQNRPAVKVRPVEDGDVEVAEAFQGIIRHICDRSNADQAFDTALQHAVVGGFGFFRICTDYAHEKTFNQDILIKRVRNPLSVLLDPNAQEADGSDARYGFVIEEMTKEEFESAYPKAKYVDWELDSRKYSDGWMDDKTVRIAEYFYRVEKQTTLHRLADNTLIEDEDYETALAELGQGLIPPIVETRQIPGYKVKWCKLSGAEILEENDWLGKYIPIIPVYGNEADIEGRVVYSGLVRRAKDAQRLYNFARSAFAERVAMTPKAPWIAADEAIEGKTEWKTQNINNVQVLRFNALDADGKPLPVPQRVQPADVPAGFAQDMQISEHDIQSALGMYAASVGQPSNEKSGRAIMARQREGDVATFHFQDNQSRAIGYLGRQLIDLIPKYYDSKRVIRILGEDGEAKEAEVDPEQPTAVMRMGDKAIYNLNVGLYDVSVSSGPSYTTKRMEAADAMIQLTQANPAIWQTHGDLIVKAQDWPGAEEFAERTKLVMPPPLRQAIEQANGPQALPPQIQQAIQAVQAQQQQVEQAQQMLAQMAQQVQAEKQFTEAEKAKLEAARKELDSSTKLLQSRYEELSAKLELQATKAAQVVPPAMPPGYQEPAIDPSQPAPVAGF